MESLNRMAIELADEALEFAAELDIRAHDLANGATAIDFGIDERGGIEAGLLLVELQTAGMATVQTRMDEVAGAPFPHVELATDSPALALLGSQKGGWEVSVEGYEGLGSGPARALVAEEEAFRAMGYTDAFDLTVLSIESDAIPTAAVAEHVAGRTELRPEAVYLPVYRTASMAGSVSGAARAAELAVFRLFELGYDPMGVVAASSSAPIPPVADSEEAAMGRTNDAVVYGGQVHLTVEEDADVLEDVASTAAVTYGDPFLDIFERVGWDVSQIDQAVFGPAHVTIDVLGGPTYTAGEVHDAILADSFGVETS